MDDGLVLNLAVEDDAQGHSARATQGKKGGRWTDRLKAKRVAKRKIRVVEDVSGEATLPSETRPAKRARREPENSRRINEPSSDRVPPTSRPPTQIISSLFTSNPKLEATLESARPSKLSAPSNAPLSDASTFSGLGLDPLIAAHLETKMHISKPTSIQRASLPALLSRPSQDSSPKDVFIQSQTGSGKTLSFLLPIIQDLLPLSSHSYIDRSIGTLAIIIAPTRELAKQISDVLEALLQLRLRSSDESPDDVSAPRLTRWLVSGILTGGSTRTHEKARLRKGLPILVATPGRLLDHLQNTSSFNVGKCRWLVLDEADRLMELGFEETIQGIIKGLDGRRKLAVQAVEEGNSMEVGGWDWNRRRRTVLCSATLREDVQKLAGTALLDPIVIKALQHDPFETADGLLSSGDTRDEGPMDNTKFTPPSQLLQKYVTVPLKLRLVTLVALLRSLLAQSQVRRGTKIIIFLSCTDSVDFHWHLLGGVSMGDGDTDSDSDESDDAANGDEQDDSGPSKRVQDPKSERVEVKSSVLPDASIFRLHGSLPLQTRLASLRGFSASPDKSKDGSASSSILLCTSVASRGLDLPLVRAVIQYDLPTENGATEYVHRVGRTARVGKGGEAWSFVAPSESAWVNWLQDKMQGGAGDSGGVGKKRIALQAVGMDTVLRQGFGGKGNEYEERATDVQLSFERWVLANKSNATYARKAFVSHIRAYATHPSDEKHIFHIRHLHLGHLAKAFALREAPSAVNGAGSKPKPRATKNGTASTKGKRRGREEVDDFDVRNAEKRMERVVRAQGRLTKKGGKMVSSGTSEFQLASGDVLEKLVSSSRT